MNFINICILLGAIFVMVYCIYLMKEFKVKRYCFLPLLVWAIHLTIFYSVILVASAGYTVLDEFLRENDLFNMWSTWQRFHGVLTMCFMTIMVGREIREHHA